MENNMFMTKAAVAANQATPTAPGHMDGALFEATDVARLKARGATALAESLVIITARVVEERSFRERFRAQWVVAVASDGDGVGLLLAVDGTQGIIDTNRAARNVLSLNSERIRRGLSLWSVFRPKLALFRGRHGVDRLARLSILGTDEMRNAIVTPPLSFRSSLVFHARPRLGLLEAAAIPERPGISQGGLSPAILRRVLGYIDDHLTERIQLIDLASVAGLSVYHFAREFKRSVGLSPHSYVTQKRIGKAEHMLAETELPLSEIALVAGFFDQSHLARHFREVAGVTPTEYRRSRR